MTNGDTSEIQFSNASEVEPRYGVPTHMEDDLTFLGHMGQFDLWSGVDDEEDLVIVTQSPERMTLWPDDAVRELEDGHEQLDARAAREGGRRAGWFR